MIKEGEKRRICLRKRGRQLVHAGAGQVHLNRSQALRSVGSVVYRLVKPDNSACGRMCTSSTCNSMERGPWDFPDGFSFQQSIRASRAG
jgi:hypothetical protein